MNMKDKSREVSVNSQFKFICDIAEKIDGRLESMFEIIFFVWKSYRYLCVFFLILGLVFTSFIIYWIADVGETLVFLGLIVSIFTVLMQNKKFRLAKIEAEVSALSDPRLELIKKLRVIYDYDDPELVQNLYDEHSVMVEFLFGRSAVAIFDRIRYLQRVTGNLASLSKPPTQAQDDLFNDSYAELCEQKDNFYDILYKSIRVSSYV